MAAERAATDGMRRRDSGQLAGSPGTNFRAGSREVGRSSRRMGPARDRRGRSVSRSLHAQDRLCPDRFFRSYPSRPPRVVSFCCDEQKPRPGTQPLAAVITSELTQTSFRDPAMQGASYFLVLCSWKLVMGKGLQAFGRAHAPSPGIGVPPGFAPRHPRFRDPRKRTNYQLPITIHAVTLRSGPSWRHGGRDRCRRGCRWRPRFRRRG